MGCLLVVEGAGARALVGGDENGVSEFAVIPYLVCRVFHFEVLFSNIQDFG